MIMLVLLLSKEYPDLAMAEAEAIMGLGTVDGSMFICENNGDYKRLAYCNYVLEFIGKSLNSLQTYRMDGTFMIEKFGTAGHRVSDVAEAFNNPVDLRQPDNRIIITGDYIGRLLWSNPKDFLQRKPHMRPFMHPSSLDPKLAKAMVNMLGISNGTVMDPFCGSGGLLIEAGLMGFRVVGYDIEKKMLQGCEKNLKHYGIKDYQLKLKNALTMDKYKHIVTDMPYGRNTKDIDNSLYKEFFKRLNAKKAVIGLPSTVRIPKNGIEREFIVPLHKTLKKRIVVINRN